MMNDVIDIEYDTEIEETPAYIPEIETEVSPYSEEVEAGTVTDQFVYESIQMVVIDLHIIVCVLVLFFSVYMIRSWRGTLARMKGR